MAREDHAHAAATSEPVTQLTPSLLNPHPDVPPRNPHLRRPACARPAPPAGEPPVITAGEALELVTNSGFNPLLDCNITSFRPANNSFLGRQQLLRTGDVLQASPRGGGGGRRRLSGGGSSGGALYTGRVGGHGSVKWAMCL